jgi:predicted metal-binding membrane protein
MSASAQAGVRPGGGLAPALSAVRARRGLVAVLFAVAALGWLWTGAQMRGMDNGPWTGLGGFGWFLGVWVVMMAAMMFPSVAPTVALYSRMTERRSPLLPLVFVAGYLLTWAAAGVLAFGTGWQSMGSPEICSRGPRRTVDAGGTQRRRRGVSSPC